MSDRNMISNPIQPVYRQIGTRFDSRQKILWCYMDPKPRGCFSFPILEDLRKFQEYLERTNRQGLKNGNGCPIPYVVFTSASKNIFNLGGDLELFMRCIQEGNREELRKYASLCVDVLFSNYISYGLPMTTFILAKGDALGGGFEAVLSGNVIVAEQTAQFGLPEILFNMFPGMGAYSLLARKIGAPLAEKIILSGKVYSAAEMHEMGVVDILAPQGEGESAIYEYIGRHGRKRNAYQAILKVRQMINGVEREELDEIANIWVESALNLGPKDMKLMARLIRAQERLLDGAEEVEIGISRESQRKTAEEITKLHTPAS